MTDTVSREVAEAEFVRFCEAMALVFDESKMTDEDKKGFLAQKETFLGAVERGQITVNEDGEPTLHLLRPVTFTAPGSGEKTISELTFYEPSGATFRAIDGKGKLADAQKTQAMLAQLCRTSIATFENMKNRDFRVANAVFMLFLG